MRQLTCSARREEGLAAAATGAPCSAEDGMRENLTVEIVLAEGRAYGQASVVIIGVVPAEPGKGRTRGMVDWAKRGTDDPFTSSGAGHP